MKQIVISVEGISLRAELFDTPTAHEVERLLPIEASVAVWGQEIYFDIPLETGLEAEARQDVEVGDLGYWPDGPALCIFFGPTPVSTTERPRAYSPVNVFGRTLDDARVLRKVRAGAAILVSPGND